MLAICAVFGLLACASSAYGILAETDAQRISVSSTGLQGNGESHGPSLSFDGHFASFVSGATNLVTDDTNDRADVFVRDRQAGSTVRVSVSTEGMQGNGNSTVSALSGDGRFVAFQSSATNLVSGDTNGVDDIFVHDRIAGTTVRVSVGAAGVQATGASANPDISADGRYVSFDSAASNLVAGDTNGRKDIFVYDMIDQMTIRANPAVGGSQADQDSVYPAISGDGQRISFTSAATNLVAGDTNVRYEVFLRDLSSGTTTRVAVGPEGIQANGVSEYASLSGDGRFVTFHSDSTNLVTGDTNDDWDAFVRDTTTGVTRRVSVSSGGFQLNSISCFPQISDDGRYVAFSSPASNVVYDDVNSWDVFVHDTLTSTTVRVSTGMGATEPDNVSHGPSISGDGNYAGFFSRASNLVLGDTNGTSDAFVVGIDTSRTPASVKRVPGATRYDVAAGLARQGWDSAGDEKWIGVREVIIANGESGKEADPLAAAGLSGVYNAPVFLVQKSRIPVATKDALVEIAANNPGVAVHLIGGTGSVPDARWNEIRAIVGVGSNKDRIGGVDRYEVSANIASRIATVSASKGTPVEGALLIAADNPAAFYDALAASPIASANTMPLLSVRKGSIPLSVRTVIDGPLKGKPLYAVSGPAYIGASANGATRLATSSDRYVAATQIALEAIDREWAIARHTGVAAKLPDALTGGAFLGKKGGVLLYTDSSSVIRASSGAFISSRKAQMQRGWIFGGTGSVPTSQEDGFRNLVQ